MQTITEIAKDETLRVSGVYHYHLGGKDTHIREPWTIHEKSDGTRITRVERDASFFKANLLTEVVTSAGKISRIDIRWQNGDEKLVSEATATYIFDGNDLQISRVCDGQSYEEQHSLSDDVLISPLMRIGIGYVLTALVKYPEGTQVLIPNIKEPGNPDKLLSAYFERRQAKELSTEPVVAGGQMYQSKRYQYVGELYDEDAQFWLDKHDILLSYSWKQSDGMKWLVDLHDYERQYE